MLVLFGYYVKPCIDFYQKIAEKMYYYIVIIVTVTKKLFSIYKVCITLNSKQGEKIVVLCHGNVYVYLYSSTCSLLVVTTVFLYWMLRCYKCLMFL
jgi:hypothetical protein